MGHERLPMNWIMGVRAAARTRVVACMVVWVMSTEQRLSHTRQDLKHTGCDDMYCRAAAADSGGQTVHTVHRWDGNARRQGRKDALGARILHGHMAMAGAARRADVLGVQRSAGL